MKLIESIIPVLLLLSLVCGQPTIDEDQIFRDLAPDEKKLLLSKLEKLIEYQSNYNWEAMYDMLASTYLQGRTKSEYIYQHKEFYENKYPKLVTFRPKSFERVINKQYTIWGCAKYLVNDNEKIYSSIVDVYFEGDKIYFTEICIVNQSEEEHINDCLQFSKNIDK